MDTNSKEAKNPTPEGTGNPNDYYYPNRGFASEQKQLYEVFIYKRSE